MKNVLIINSSPNAQSSVSTQLTSLFAQQLSAEQTFNITTRNIGIQPPAHLDELTLSAFFSPSDSHSLVQAAAVRLSDQLISEVQQADIIIIGSAMHNLSITSGLKAYFDQILRAGVTFKYGENGPEGLLKDKQVFVITAAGGDYSLEYMQAMDFQTPYLKQVLAFIGLTEVSFIAAQGLSMGEETATKNIASAKQQILKITESLIAA